MGLFASVDDILIALLFLLIFSRGLGLLFRRVNISSVVGEVLGGILLSPLVLGLLDDFSDLETFAESPGAATSLFITDDQGLWWEWGIYSSYIRAYGETAGGSPFDNTANLGSYRWFRLRESGNRFLMEARSAAADPWSEVWAVEPSPVEFPVRIGLMINVWQPLPVTYTVVHHAAFKNFNLP